MARIQHLFEDTQRTIPARSWVDDLLKNQSLYTNCFVRSITHVKDINNTWVHEYLQAIIENMANGDRTRIIAERQTDYDKVIIGRWKTRSLGTKSFALFSSSGSSGSGSGSGSGDLPLPLYSLVFKENSLSVLQLAATFKEVSIKLGDYHFVERNCYDFAYSAYLSAKFRSGFRYIEESWSFARWRGKYIYFVYAAKGDAGRFDDQRDSKMEYAPGDPSNNWKWMESIYKDAIHLEADSEDEANEKIENELTGLVVRDLETKATMTNLQSNQKEAEDLFLNKVYDDVLNDSESSRYRELYDQLDKSDQAAQVLLPGFQEVPLVPEELKAIVLKDSQAKKVDDALKVIVGSILADHQKEAN